MTEKKDARKQEVLESILSISSFWSEIQTKALEKAPEKTVSPGSKCRSTGIMQWWNSFMDLFIRINDSHSGVWFWRLPGQVKWHWHLVCRDEGCCYECPTMHVAAPITNNDPAPKVSSAKVEELCSKSLPCWSGSSSLPYRYMSDIPLIWLTSASARASQMTQHKASTWQCKRHGFDPWVRKIPWRREWHPLLYSCLENPWTEEPGGLPSMGSQSWTQLKD